MNYFQSIVPFEMFEKLYMYNLMAEDCPSCYIAYLRTEAEFVRQFGEQRHRSYVSFRNRLSQHRKRLRQLKHKKLL